MRAMGARRSKGLVGLSVVVAAALAAAVAAGSVIVVIYRNDFRTGGRAHQLTSISSKHCNKHVDGGNLKIEVSHGPNTCNYRLPVEADGPKSNLDLQADFKLGKETKSSLRKSSRFGFRMRANGLKKYYEVRVFPKGHKYVVRRSPGGQEFPVKGKSDAIKPVGHFTTIQMRTFGHAVVVYFNGKKVVDVHDPDPGDLAGGQLQVFAGYGKHSNDKSIFQLDDVRVSVKKP
jgi:3-keto-disaccharide hydrolase